MTRYGKRKKGLVLSGKREAGKEDGGGEDASQTRVSVCRQGSVIRKDLCPSRGRGRKKNGGGKVFGGRRVREGQGGLREVERRRKGTMWSL